MFKHSAKKTALLLAFLAFTPVCNGAFAQTVTGGDPVPGPYRPSSSSTSAGSTSSMTAMLMALLLALQGA